MPQSDHDLAGHRIQARAVILAAVIAAVATVGVALLNGRQQEESAGSRPSEAYSKKTDVKPEKTEVKPEKSDGFGAEFAGAWEGTIEQSDGKRWPIRLVIRAGSRVAEVVYHRPGCSGTESLTGHRGASLIMRERISLGKSVCTDEGIVELTLAGDYLHFTYVAERDTAPGSYSATAMLTRAPD